MSSPETILQIAQTIHAELTQQHPLHSKLGDAITQLAAGQIESNDLILLLASDEKTRQHMAELLKDSSAETTLQSKGFAFKPLAGQSPSHAQKYKCPQCDRTARHRGTVPQCPDHGAMVRAEDA
ncbi:MAG: hypothetical protein ACPGVO_08570 [Spirulinaceae cyanobacterium]